MTRHSEIVARKADRLNVNPSQSDLNRFKEIRSPLPMLVADHVPLPKPRPHKPRIGPPLVIVPEYYRK